jgi:RNA polymerase sigma-70 factor (ECF subfamily)
LGGAINSALSDEKRPAFMNQTESHRRLYEQWVRLYAPELYRYALRLSGQSQIAEDLVQETFMEAWKSIARQKDPARARAWLFQILRYRFSHYRRDNRHHHQTQALAESSDHHPSDTVRPALETLADQDWLAAGLAVLSPNIRQTFLMVFQEGRTCRETAESLHIPIGTVLSRLDSARHSLRAAMGHLRHPSNANPAAHGKEDVRL